MSAEADQLVARLKSRSLDRFVTLCKMHLSFLLDLPGSSLEELLGSSSSSESASSDRLWGFGNFTRRKSIKGTVFQSSVLRSSLGYCVPVLGTVLQSRVLCSSLGYCVPV